MAIDSGGTQAIFSGGTASGTIVSSGGTQDVNLGGTALGTAVSSGGTEYDAGVSSDTTLDGGTEVVFGSDTSATVDSGGTQEIAAGGTTLGTTVSSGGVQYDAGVSSDTTLDGGTEVVFGSDTSAIVNRGGIQQIAGGGTGGDVTIQSGGTVQVVDGGTLLGVIANAGTLAFDIVGSTTFSGSPTGNGTLVVSGGGDLHVTMPYSGSAEIDDNSTLEFGSTFAGAATFRGSPTGPGGTLKLDAGSTGPINVVDPNDTVIAQPGSGNWINAIVSYTLPTNIDTLFLLAGAQGTGNSDASGDALYALDAGNAQTLTGNSANDTFVVYNSSDVVVPKAGSHDLVYSAANYTLPAGVDSLILEAGTQAIGNSDAAGDALYAANAGFVQTLIGNSANDTFVVYDSADVVVPKAGSHDLAYSAVNYTLPAGVDSLILEAGTQAIGNSDAVGDTLYAANAGIAQTLTGHSHNDTFVVYNSADTVIGQASSTDKIYAAASFTLPTNVDTLFLEGNASLGTGNSDANDLLFGNAGVASTLVAGSGADLLVVAGTAGTIMTGGAGHDTFAFPNVMGKDEVTNFGLAKDTLQFNATLFSNFTAAMNAASQSGANTVFTIDANDTVTLDNVAKTSLTSSNFHFS
jgi:autotransporter passenger strand-loop-strand repeat protein